MESSHTHRHGFGHRRGRGFAITLAAAGLLASACGSTAYRDAVEVDAVGEAGVGASSVGAGGTPSGETTVDPTTGEVVDTGTGLPPGEDGEAAVGTSGGTSTGGGTSGGTSAGGGASGGTSGGGTSGGGTAGGGTGGGTSGDGTTGGDTTGPATGTPVKVGFLWLKSTREFQEALGFSSSALGPLDKIAAALAAYVNERGGLGGRPIEPVMQDYFMEEAAPDREAQICNSLADDAKIEAVVFQGQFSGSTRYCYAGKGITMMDPAPFVFDDDLYAETSPYYWSPAYPNYSRIVKALVPNLKSRAYFDPMTSRAETETKVGILLWDSPSEKRILETDMLPALAAAGIDVELTHAVDQSNAGTIQNGLANGVVRFRNAGVNRVLFIGGSPLAPFFYLNAEQANFRPRYGLSTLDAPRHTENSQTNPRQMDDAIGIGMNPINDVRDPQYPWPSSNKTELLCIDIVKDVHTYATRADAQAMLAYCESILLLKAGADLAGQPFEPKSWAAGAERLGDSWLAATPYASSFGPGKHDGGDLYREITHNKVCPTPGTTGSCFTISGPMRRFP